RRFAASSANMSKNRSSRGMRRRRIAAEATSVDPRVRRSHSMDGLVIAFVAIQAIALAVALGVAWSRGRALEAVDGSLREAEGATPGATDARDRRGPSWGTDEDDLTDRLRRLRRRAEAAEFNLEQRLRDLAYLADLVGVGIVRLSDDLRVEVANTAAHVFLRR